MNSLGNLNDVLHEQLERLNELDATDIAALDAEVKRTKAMGEVAKAITSSAKVVLDSIQMRYELQGARIAADTEMPKMLDGD